MYKPCNISIKTNKGSTVPRRAWLNEARWRKSKFHKNIHQNLGIAHEHRAYREYTYGNYEAAQEHKRKGLYHYDQAIKMGHKCQEYRNDMANAWVRAKSVPIQNEYQILGFYPEMKNLVILKKGPNCRLTEGDVLNIQNSLSGFLVEIGRIAVVEVQEDTVGCRVIGEVDTEVIKPGVTIAIPGDDRHVFDGKPKMGVEIREHDDLVCVQAVQDGLGAKKAGIKAGDHIIQIEGKSVSSTAELISRLAEFSIGDIVTVKVDRQGQTLQFKVKLME